MKSYLKILCTGLCTFILVLNFIGPLQGQSLDFDSQFGVFVQEYKRGQNVDYKAISPDRIEVIEQSLHALDYKNAKLATQINVYNYLVIREIVKVYPIASVEEVPGFFKNEIPLGEMTVQLDLLEREILDKANDPLVHLLLNCGAKGCPALAYIDSASSFDNYYTEALSATQTFKIEGNDLSLSQIFFWYKEEYGSDAQLKNLLGKIVNKDLTNTKTAYLDYDWMLNDANASGQVYYPTKLYGKGGYELKIFNNYYTQNDQGDRFNFFSSFFQLLLGTSKRINYGIDVKLRSVNQGSIPLFSALKFQTRSFDEAETGLNFSRAGISGIGPRIKYQPFDKYPNINFLHTVYFVPLSAAQGNDDYGYADYNNLQFFNQMFFEKEYSVKRRLFLDVGLHVENIKLGVQRNQEHFMPIQLPVTAIYSYFPNTDLTLYGLGSFGQRLDIRYAPDSDTSTNYTVYGQVGAGVKYFVTDFLEAEFLYTNFIDTTPGRTAHTFNLGLRFFRF